MATFTSTLLTLAFLVVAGIAAPNHDINLKLPEECKGKGFCTTKPEGYDEMLELLDSILTPAFVESFQSNIEDRQGVVLSEKYSPRNDWHNCPYLNKTQESVYAYSDANDSHPEFIIQHKLLRQPIQSITCAYEKIKPINTTEQCFQHLGLESFKLRSSCVTSTANRTLIVFDRIEQKPVAKSYPVPCCCTCHVYRVDDMTY